MNDRICKVISDVLGVPAAAIGEDASPKTIETWEMIERESKSNVFCSKYRWADGSTDTLYEDVFVDGAKSLNSNKIRLLPTPTQLPLRPSRTERKRYQ